jgi:hypothetical protein
MSTFFLHFRLTSLSTRGTPVRNVFFNHSYVDGQFYSGPLSGSPFPDGSIPLTGWGNDPHLQSWPPDPTEIATPYVRMRDMSIGSSQCVQFFWAYGSRDLYYRGVASTDDNTAYVVVTRNSTDQRTVENAGFCPHSTDYVARLVHDETGKGNTTVTVTDGYWYVPFRLTLRRK